MDKAGNRRDCRYFNGGGICGPKEEGREEYYTVKNT